MTCCTGGNKIRLISRGVLGVSCGLTSQQILKSMKKIEHEMFNIAVQHSDSGFFFPYMSSNIKEKLIRSLVEAN